MFCGDCMKMCEDITPNIGENRPGCFTMAIPCLTLVLTPQFLSKYKMALIPPTPYSPDLASCDFFLFPKMKLKLKGHQFDTTEEIQAKSQKVLDTDRKGLPVRYSRNGGDGVTGVYMQEETTSKVMAANRPYGEFYDFYRVRPEYFGYTLI
jgi:hypothetical protein